MIIFGIQHSKTKKKLVITSDTIPSGIKEFYSDRNIIFTGPIYERGKLFALRKKAFAHVHGHSVGGTNPSLLEAIASDNLILCYDVPYNREVLEEYGYYFKNEKDLTDLISLVENKQDELNESRRTAFYQRILKEKYNWGIVIDKYLKLIQKPD